MSKTALILVQNLPVPFDRRVWQEATTLRDHGWDVDVICPSNESHHPGKFTIEGIKVNRFRAPKEARGPLGYLKEYCLSLSRMRSLMRTLSKEQNFQIVQFCNPPDILALLAWEAKFRMKSKIIFDQHDLGPELVVAKGLPMSQLLVRIARFFEVLAYKISDKVIATNESYRRIAISRGKVEPLDVTVVRSGPRRDWAVDIKTDTDYRQGHEFQIGYLGVIGKQEGLNLALDAILILRDKYKKDVLFTVVGSGTDLASISKYAQEIGIGNNVKFLGRLPDEDLKTVLASADVCLNPDVFSDLNNLSTMNKIIEYMALGVPIVQFDLAEGRFSAQEASLYAVADSPQSLAERTNYLLENFEVRAAMAKIGLQRFREVLCWENQSTSLLQVYNSLVIE